MECTKCLPYVAMRFFAVQVSLKLQTTFGETSACRIRGDTIILLTEGVRFEINSPLLLFVLAHH